MSRPARGSASYRAVLAIPRARALLATATLARLSYGLLSLPLLLAVRDGTGSYAVAGTAAGLFGLTAAVLGPYRSRLVERRRSALPALTAVYGVLLGCLAAGSALGVHAWAAVTLSVLAGVFPPPVGPLMRTRWGELAGSEAQRQSALSLDAVTESTVFAAGPVLGGLLAAAASAPLALATAAAVAVIGFTAFTSALGPAAESRRGAGVNAGAYVGAGPNADPGTGPDPGTGFGSGTGMGPGAGAGAEAPRKARADAGADAGPDPDPRADAGAGTGTAPGAGTGMGPGTAADAGPGAGKDSRPGAFAPQKAGANAGADTGAGTRSGTRWRLGPPAAPGFAPLLLVVLGSGSALALAEVGVVATWGAAGAGPLMALCATGGAAGGLVYGRMRWRIAPHRRLLALGALAAACFALPAAASGPAAVAVGLLLAGACGDTLLITAYLQVDLLIPAGSRTEASAWINTATNLGSAFGSAAAGVVISRYGPAPAFPAATAVLIVSTALAGLLRPQRQAVASTV